MVYHAGLLEQKLKELYLKKGRSSREIAKIFECSEHKVNYWLKKYGIHKRSISDAVYIKHNPYGDPFKIREPKNLKEAELYGLGLGLYWGEGTKSNKYSIRLGNTDPYLIKKFIKFLKCFYKINVKKLKFGLQIFSDMSAKNALKFWQNELKIPESQFQKVIITPARGTGTYRNKIKHGVLTVQYHNKKLRNIICKSIKNMR